MCHVRIGTSVSEHLPKVDQFCDEHPYQAHQQAGDVDDNGIIILQETFVVWILYSGTSE